MLRFALFGAAIFGSLSASMSLADVPFLEGHVQAVLIPGADIELIHAAYGTSTVDSFDSNYLLSTGGASEADVLLWLGEDILVIVAEYAYFGQSPESQRHMVVGVTGEDIETFEGQPFIGNINLDGMHSHGQGAGQRVAVIDTGIDPSHEVFAGTPMLVGFDFIDEDASPMDEFNELDDDGDGFIDAGHGHGTLVAGFVRLAAPDAEILPLRVINDEGFGLVFDVAKAIDYAIDEGATVVNLSLGLTTDSVLLSRAIDAATDAGIHVVAAAGNNSEETPAYRPAVYANVLSVTSVDSLDIKADFANWHTTVDVSAPGTQLLGPFPGDAFARASGTSFSTPVMSGLLASALSVTGALAPESCLDLMRAGVVSISELPGNEPYDGLLGSGRVDGFSLWAAIQAVVAVEPSFGFGRPDIGILPHPVRAGAPASIIPVAAGATTLEIFDISGRLLRRLSTRGESFQWNGFDANGRALAPGSYRVRTGGESAPLIVIR